MVQPLTPQAAWELWRDQFLSDCKANPTARNAWRELERAGIARQALLLLWYYAAAEDTIAQFRDGVTEVADNLEKARRAARRAEQGHNDTRPQMFAQRKEEKLQAAANSPWVDPYAEERTLADAVKSHPEVAGLSLEEAPNEFRKANEAVRRYGTKVFLCILRDYAASRGVRLGLGRLVALAECAHPEKEIDKRTLSRCFEDDTVRLAAPKWLGEFTAFLSSPLA